MKKIAFVMIGSNDLLASSKFYDAVFVPLNLIKVHTSENYIGYGQKNNPKEIEFYITKPFNKKPATYGNGTQISLLANSTEAVDKFYSIALENGGKSEGSPGIRSGDYYAYVRDLDGNKICALIRIN